MILDFGTDAQFARLVGEVRSSQYRDPRRYDDLWRNIIWSDNARERAVLDILLNDNRVYQPNLRYSDIARGAEPASKNEKIKPDPPTVLDGGTIVQTA